MLQSAINGILQISKSKSKFMKIFHRFALIYGIFLTLRKIFKRKSGEEAKA